MNPDELKKVIIKIGRALLSKGLVSGTFGNISARIDENSFLITASGRNYITLTAEEIVMVNIHDGSYRSRFKPSSEFRIHGGIYKNIPNANFVIHTHSRYASALSALNIDNFDIEIGGSYVSGLQKEKIHICEYGLPGSEDLYEKTVIGMIKSKSTGVLMKNHGSLCYGRNYKEAFDNAMSLEEKLKIHLQYLFQRHMKFSLDFEIPDRKKAYETCRKIGLVGKFGFLILKDESRLNSNYEWIKKSIVPYLDDFAQVIGYDIKTIEINDNINDFKNYIFNFLENNTTIYIKGRGLFTYADSYEEAKMNKDIIEKNILAYLATNIYDDNTPIDRKDVLSMRKEYLENYSKLKYK